MKAPLLSLALVASLACLAAAQLHPKGDLNEDYQVNLEDLWIFADHWLDAGCLPPDCLANIDGVGGVNISDFALMAENWRANGRIPLVINELMARNNSDSGIHDEWGEYDDWIEIYNYGDEAIDIGGMWMTDNLDTGPAWQIPRTNPALTTIASHGYLLIWADNQTGQGVLHASFALSGTGEDIGLYDADRNLIDSIQFGTQEQNKSYGQLPDANDHWQVFDYPTPGKSNQSTPVAVVINEIMYHPYHALNTPENMGLEYIELYNKGNAPVNLSGWRFTNGVEFVFPDVTLNNGNYLVVAADVNVFKAKYPSVTNVVGGWQGRLSNSGENIVLSDNLGMVIDRVHYSDEGDWAVRLLGPLEENNQRGWEWSDAHDGGGRSLELINPNMPNEYGQNWSATIGVVNDGTPGRVNSVVNNNIAPLILDVEHFPIIPGPNDQVTVIARVIDELTTGITARLHYRIDRSKYQSVDVYPHYNASDYNNVPMSDDGAHGDGQAGDGIYGAKIPVHPDKTIIEFFVEARDAASNTRTWPAPSTIGSVPEQVTNLLYQVDKTFDPNEPWVAGSQPIYYIIMTEMERGRLEDIGAHSGQEGPNAHMNATFISVDGVDMKVRYNVGVRNRGHGTRTGPPNNYHIGFPNDRPWKDVGAISFNCRYTHAQIIGSAIFCMANIVAPDTTPVQLRINGANLAYQGGSMYGVYVRLEAFNDDFAKKHFQGDSNGNLYSCFRTGSNVQAELLYEGANPNTYRNRYFKENNVAEDDWSDLLHMLDVLNNAPDATYLQEVSKVINVQQWVHYIALNSLLLNWETGLDTGIGDDYFLYRGTVDTRFVLIPHDLDTILDQGNMHGNINQSIFSVIAEPNSVSSQGNGVDGLKRFFKHRDIVPLYYQAFLDHINGSFNPETLNPLFDRVLGGFAPQDRIIAMKQFVISRSAAALAQIPLTIKVTSAPTPLNGYPHTTSNLVSLGGRANAITTRRVTVNGLPATWTAWQATWSISNVSLLPGINRVVIQTFDANDKEVDRFGVDIWYDTGSMTIKAGGTLSADEVWTAAGGPYHVTGSITIPAGRTLTIEPGTTVFLDSNCGFIVYGRFVAQGTQYRRIRFTRVPGTTTQWAGLQLPNTKQDNIIAYADLEFGGYRSHWITTGNNNGSVVGPTARLTIDHATFSGSDTQYFSIWDTQIIIRNSVFADLGSHYMIMAERMPTDGWFIIEGNLFGHTHGDTDIFHLNSVSVKGGPVARLINNVFTGGGDDDVDDNETDTHIEGNLFMHANVGNSGRSASAAVTTGPGGGSASANNLETQHLTVVRNIFYHNDYGILCKTDAYVQIYNNVFIQNAGAILFNEFVGSNPNQPGRAAYVESCIFWNNGPEVGGTPTDNGTGTFVNPQNTQLVVNNSIVKSQFLNLGTGNIDADPLLVDADRELYVDVNLPRFKTGFPGFADGGYLLEGMVPDVHLRPESPARGTGFNGVDMGPYVPTTASIDGVPPSPACRTDATLTVAGTDIYGYKYRIDGPGFDNTWNIELARMIPVTALTRSGLTATATAVNHGFANGDVVEITGADRAAYNGLFTIFAVTSNTFSYTLAAAVDLLHPDRLDVWVRKPQPIQLAGLTNGVYTVSVIKKNSMDVWQDVNQPTTATWTVDTSYSKLVINELLAHNHSAVEHEGTFPDMVELYYDGPVSLPLAGIRITDSPNEPNKLFVFTSGAINPGQYLVLYADSNTATSGTHLGFALNADGDALYLYDKNGVLLDSVKFGLQLADLSIGRTGRDGKWCLTMPTFGQPNIQQPLGNPDTLKINEWLANEEVLFNDDFIELHNPHANPVDLSGMYLTDNPITQPGKHKIGPLNFIAGNGFAVFNADDSNNPGHVNFRLSADQGMIGLFDAQLKEIDKVLYGPQTTDVSYGRAPDGANNFEFFALPTPGVANPGATIVTVNNLIVIDDRWSYNQSGDQGSAWRATGYNDSSWPTGKALLYVEDSALPAPKNTPLTIGRITYYFRRHFWLNADPANVSQLKMSCVIDDGMVVYINGDYAYRHGMNEGEVYYSTLANRTVGNAVYEGPFNIPLDRIDLKQGDNVIAVEVHQCNAGSTDIVFGLTLDAVITSSEQTYAGAFDLLDGLRITELMYHAPDGSEFDYIELYNISDIPLDLNGVRFTQGIDFTFPPMTLESSHYVVVVSNIADFQSRYVSSASIAGQYSGNLSNGGEDIVLKLPAPLEAAILRFRYSDAWYPTTDGSGDSLTIRDPLAHPATWNQPESWHPASPTPGGP